MVGAAEAPWNDHWLPFTNFDLLVPPFDVGSTFFYKKPSNESLSFPIIVKTLKASFSRALSLYPPLAGQIAWNEAAAENQIQCNNQGVDFVEAVADVELKELNLCNPDECIEGKLMPKKLLRGVLTIQVTKLKCEGIVIGVMVDHRIVDGYSANMFISSWADMTRSKTPSMVPSFGRSYLNPRSPTVYSSLIDNVFAPFLPPSNTDNDSCEEDEYLLVNRIYYIKGEQLKMLQSLASEKGCGTSKLVAFTSFLWKEVAMSMEDSGKHSVACNVVVTVDGRSRLSEGDGEEKEKLMASHFGNVLSMPYGSKKPQEFLAMAEKMVTQVQHDELTEALNDVFSNVSTMIKVIDAYLNGLEASGLHGLSVVTSVASFFVSRVDTLVDKMLEKLALKRSSIVEGRCRPSLIKLCKHSLTMVQLEGPLIEAEGIYSTLEKLGINWSLKEWILSSKALLACLIVCKRRLIL